MKMLVRALATAVVLTVFPVSAAPEGTRIESVEQCDGDDCGDAVGSGQVVRGTVRVRAATSSTLGIDWLRLEAQPEGSPRWLCVQQWSDATVGGYAETVEWDTSWWDRTRETYRCPEATDHIHALTPNGRVTLRALARERTTGEMQESDGFPIRLANGIAAARWAGEPALDGRAVKLRWQANPEPDVLEYEIRRRDPDGKRASSAIEASKPEQSGCRRVETVYECTDRTFSGRPGGGYRYELLAYRPSPSSDERCPLSRRECVASASETRDVTVPAPGEPVPTVSVAAPEESPSPSPGSTAAVATPTGSITAGSPAATQSPAPVAARAQASADPRDRWPLVALAFAVIAPLASMHASRWGRKQEE